MTVEPTAEFPEFRVLHGNPDREEVAALVAVLVAVAQRGAGLGEVAGSRTERAEWERHPPRTAAVPVISWRGAS
ncbi:acyl-CoA carboxylase epsilon subunit [Streptomyces sp. 8N706]|uniref:acyl-CoA carboxylase epsilon subunit n=1 Tax=Streptomyces sp. 8N706 TaxID=3457416 RepID=UPI003FD4AC86